MQRSPRQAISPACPSALACIDGCQVLVRSSSNTFLSALDTMSSTDQMVRIDVWLLEKVLDGCYSHPSGAWFALGLVQLRWRKELGYPSAHTYWSHLQRAFLSPHNLQPHEIAFEQIWVTTPCLLVKACCSLP